MGFLGNIFSATLKTALTPVAIAKDAIKVVVGEEPDSTKRHLKSIGGDIEDATDDLCDGNI